MRGTVSLTVTTTNSDLLVYIFIPPLVLASSVWLKERFHFVVIYFCVGNCIPGVLTCLHLSHFVGKYQCQTFKNNPTISLDDVFLLCLKTVRSDAVLIFKTCKEIYKTAD